MQKQKSPPEALSGDLLGILVAAIGLLQAQN